MDIKESVSQQTKNQQEEQGPAMLDRRKFLVGESVSVSIEEVRSQDWKEKVYEPDILNGPGKLCKKPGYKM
ncbi:MAG TPA: hypothetical protein VFG09_13840 [Thermodesulfovibrionales bacterium]|jgi:hypothetical protein|nr:hypothetical protein [Thermodesulfovibrionales bacterium]